MCLHVSVPVQSMHDTDHTTENWPNIGAVEPFGPWAGAGGVRQEYCTGKDACPNEAMAIESCSVF